MGSVDRQLLEPTKIEISDLVVKYETPGNGDTQAALSKTTLNVRDGEFVAIVGPSGCGKTTLLNCVAGLVRASSGFVRVDGKIVGGRGRDRGVVFQQYALFPWLSVIENVIFSLEMRGVPRTERANEARRYLDLVGLSGVEDVMPKALSGGMKQRVAIARAYAAEPSVLLMDEPFGALDVQAKERLQVALLRALQLNPRTVLFVTHDVEEAIFLSDRVVIMGANPGRIVSETPVELQKDRVVEDKLSEEFIALKSQISQELRVIETGKYESEAVRKNNVISQVKKMELN
ncbi:MAG: ABC transporter ATP-binding protein [Nitrososphaerota archaeon]|nr:ABC transporter ATP-binding protein [Nitrososphaerota archaeon]